MKKNVPFSLKLLLLIVTLLIVGKARYVKAQDYDFVLEDLKLNYTMEMHGRDGIPGTHHFYKITATKPGYITVKAIEPSYDTFLFVRSDIPEYYDDFYSLSGDVPYYTIGRDSTSCQIPVDVGDNYIYAYYDVTVQCKYTKATNKTNFCKANAITLKKKKKVTICQTPSYNYNRWYKITLKKASDLVVWKDGSADFKVYNSKMRLVQMDRATGGNRSFSSNKLKKGTYYIVFLQQQYANRVHGNITKFYWQ